MEGFAIIVAVAVVVIVSSLNDYQKELQFQKLNAKKDYRKVRVIRDGEERMVCIQCLVVGDILHIEPGDSLGADAIVLMASNLKCDESSLTGESNTIWKATYEDSLSLSPSVENQNADGQSPPSSSSNPEPFLLSGSKVLQGVGTCVVVAVGKNSFYGKTLLASRKEQDPTPLQNKLDKLAGTITKLGSIAALLMLTALLVKYFVELGKGNQSRKATDIINSIVNIIIAAVTIIVVAVPEGLPLAIATKRMLKDNCFVRLLASCETMGNATAICSDKTGTLTQNRMTVVTGTLGDQYRFSSYPPGIAKQQRKQATLPPVDGLITDAKGQAIDPKEQSSSLLLKAYNDGKRADRADDQLSDRQLRRLERYRRRRRHNIS